MSRPLSITNRMTLSIGGTCFALLLLSGLFLYWQLSDNVHADTARFLADKAYVLRALIRDRSNDMAALDEETRLEGAARRFTSIGQHDLIIGCGHSR
jgi:hypothetical protein